MRIDLTMRLVAVLAFLVCGALMTQAKAQDAPTVRLHAAGSLRGAMTEIAASFAAVRHIRVDLVFGASGLLRERFEKGEAGDVFASADMGNPRKLEAEGKSGPVVLFARNRLCALVRPGLALTSDALLAAMLDPHVKLGTSTPLADPSGDYAWEVFRKADALKPGSRAALEAKALQLTGGANSAPPPDGVNPYAWHLRDGHADLFLAYCTAGQEVTAQVPGASVVALPPALATGADYGLTLLKTGSPVRAELLGSFILSAAGREILARHGFDAPVLP